MNFSQQSMIPNLESKEYLFCPNENCLNVPEIVYSYNPLKNEVQYKCKCHANYNKSMKMPLHEFLEKSNIICYDCRKIIKESNFLFCKKCGNNMHNNCQKNHAINNNHFYFGLFNKNNLLNNCKEHKANFIFRCMNCNESLCGICDLNNHNQKEHTLKQIIGLMDKNSFEKMNFILNKQKNILGKIKQINNKLIKQFENDIQIKQKIINNYMDNKANYCSVLNLINLYLKNNENYENYLTNFLKEKEEKQINENNNDTDIDKYTDEILLPFYYSMMINKDELLNEHILNNLENKIKKLKTIKTNYIENQHLSKNNNDIYNFNDFFKLSSNNKEKSNIKLKEDKDDNIYENNKQKKAELNKNLSEKKKFEEIISNQNEKNKVYNTNKEDKEIYLRNNMISLKSGNFAISIRDKVEIYNFRKLILQPKKVFDEKLINNCLLQEIFSNKNGRGKFIEFIFQFIDETLFYSSDSKIIRIQLLDNDTNHQIIGCINLENMEFIRNMISLGNSMFVTLSDKDDYCKIKIYSKNDEIKNNNLYHNQDENNCNNEKQNSLTNNMNPENQIKNIRKNNNNINEDSKFKIVFDNINENNIIWNSLFELKKNNNNYLHEFILTSNAEYAGGENIVEFYGMKKILNEYKIEFITKINGISCSVEPNTICQLNEKYICIGLQNYNRPNQKNGYAIIDIYNRILYKIIEKKNESITSMFYLNEKQLLLSTMKTNNKSCLKAKLYKFVKKIGNKENIEKDEFDLNELYQFKTNELDIIISSHLFVIQNFEYEIIIIITSSNKSNIEIIKKEINNS